MLFLVNGVLYERVGNLLIKAGRRAKPSPGQMDLFSMDAFAAPAALVPRKTTPKTPKTPKPATAKPPKVPATPGLTVRPKEGDRRINRAGNEEILRGGRWRRFEAPEPTPGAIGGLDVIQDDIVSDRSISRTALDRIVRTDFPGYMKSVLGAIAGVNPSDIEVFDNSNDEHVRIQLRGETFSRLIPIQDEPNIADKIVDRAIGGLSVIEEEPTPVVEPEPEGDSAIGAEPQPVEEVDPLVSESEPDAKPAITKADFTQSLLGLVETP
ncbi:MAG TPA: hypothetical protein V6C46_07645, partial [Coleofasciculaceae cyanobacterium]